MLKNQKISFKSRVLEAVRQIPKGEVMSYKDVAWLAGSPGAFRAVGNIMSKNYDPTVPCHRVVRADGRLGNYNRGGSASKLKKLRQEGYKGDIWPID